MKPLNSNMHLKPEEGCTKISSSCVIWQGPDIPCINLCKGDTVTDVVYNLATVLCDITEGVVDISGLDFKCIIDEGIAEPTTLIATLQAIIDKQCFFEENCCSDGSGGSVITPISLPACLYYTEDGDEITSLLPAQYSQYLASKICEIITNITSINSAISNLQGRVTVLENASTGGGSAGAISVVSQCASSPVPGTVVPIAQAFSSFEGKFCQLTSLLGTNAALSTAIGKECAGLDSAPQLTDSEQLMSEIPGWVSSPSTLSETIVNMWLTICDMRTAIQACCSGTTTGCVPVPVSNVAVTNLSVSGSTIIWDAPVVGANENPIQYNVKAYEWNGTTIVGSPIFNANVAYPATSYNVTVVPDPAKNYQVQVIAEYSCDNSPVATSVNKLALTSVLYCVDVVDTNYDEVTELCGGESFVNRRRKTTFTLKDITTNATVGNAYAPFNISFNYDLDGTCLGTSVETITKTFSTGMSVVEHIYYSERYIQCGADPCAPETRLYSCIQEITGDRAVACPGEITCLT
jgi:hypothetical protein